MKMPKLKVHRGAAKRFKKTAAGYKRKHAMRSHILTKMTTKRKRHLRRKGLCTGKINANMAQLLGGR